MPNPFAVTGTNDSFFFDGPNKEIVVGTATSSINMQYVYSFWKQWILEGNAQFLPAFRVVGGDPLGGDSRVATYMFLTNLWRFRVPTDATEDLFVSGAVLNTDELDSPFRSDSVLITLEQPISVQYVASLETEQILADIAEFRRITEKVIAPELYYLRNTVEKTLAPNALKIVSPVVDAVYDTTTGITTITTQIPEHGFAVGDRVHLVGMAMTCNTDQGQTIINFPDIELGQGVYPSPGDIDQPYVFPVIGVPALNQLTVQAGISSIEHFYTYGGVVSRLQSDVIEYQLGVPELIKSNNIVGLSSYIAGISTVVNRIDKVTKLIPGTL